jgi:hypothetical protein
VHSLHGSACVCVCVCGGGKGGGGGGVETKAPRMGPRAGGGGGGGRRSREGSGGMNCGFGEAQTVEDQKAAETVEKGGLDRSAAGVAVQARGLQPAGKRPRHAGAAGAAQPRAACTATVPAGSSRCGTIRSSAARRCGRKSRW